MLNNCKPALKQLLAITPKIKMNIFDGVNPKLFDVSLRDGLQSLPESFHHLYSIPNKKQLFYNILWEHKPDNLEVGSLVNPKLMPIFKDSLELFKELNEERKQFWGIEKPENIYMVVPNKKKLDIAIENGVRYFSLLTSVSDSFQKKNINKNLNETKEELNKMYEVLKNSVPDYKTKLYISCINKCPIEGPIDNDFIINQIMNYNMNYNPDLLCLSDTCGSINADDYEYIVDTCMYFGLPASKICVHLHFNPNDQNQLKNAKKIVHSSFNKKIQHFDVSKLEYGGCSMTIKKEEMLSNLSYETFYDFLKEYIDEKSGS